MEGLARQTIYGANPNFSAFPIIVQLRLFSDRGSAGSAEHPSCKQPAVRSLEQYGDDQQVSNMHSAISLVPFKHR